MATATENRSLHAALWVAAAAVTLASAAAIGAIFGWIPTGKAEAPAPIVASASAPVPQLTPQLAAPAVAAVEPALDETGPTPAPAKPRKTPVKHPAAPKAPAVARANPSSAVEDLPRPVAVAPAPPPRCNECGTIESINAVETAGEGTGIGAVAGAVLGGVLGHQVGEGNGKRLAKIGGAVLGGFAGNEAEKRIRKSTQWDVAVRMNDGSERHVTTSTLPTWHDGEAVRVVDGQILAAANATL